MSTTTQFTTFADLYNGLLKAMRTDTSNTATVEQAKRYINTAHSDMHVGFAEKVPWAIRDYSVTSRTFASILGTISLSTIVFPQPTGVVEYSYEINNEDLIDIPTRTKMVAVTSATGYDNGREGSVLRTDNPVDPQPLNGYSTSNDDVYQVGDIIRFYQDDISMPTDFMRLAGNQIRIGTRDLDLIGRVEFRHQYAGKIELGRPYAATIIDSWDHDENGLDQRKIRLFPIPDVAERIYISYVTKNIVEADDGLKQTFMSDDGDQPIMPIRYRHAIFYHALYNWYRDRKDDTRSQEAKAEYVEIMSRIVNDTEAGQSNFSIRPNISSYRRKAGRPYRRRGGPRYDFGRFDRME